MHLRKLALYGAAALASLSMILFGKADNISERSVPNIDAIYRSHIPSVAKEVPYPDIIPPVQLSALYGKKICIDPGHHYYWGIGATGRDRSGNVPTHPQENIRLYEDELTVIIAYKIEKLLKSEGADVCVTRKERIEKRENADLQIQPYDFTGDGVVFSNAPEGGSERTQPRIDWMNQFGAETIISIHFNGYDDPRIRGTEVYYSDTGPYAEKNRMLAEKTLTALLSEMEAAGFQTNNRGIQIDRYQRYPPDVTERIISYNTQTIIKNGYDPNNCYDCQRLSILGNNPMTLTRGDYVGALIEAEFLSNPDVVEDFIMRPDSLDIIARGLAKGIINYYSEESQSYSLEPREISQGNPNGVALTFDCGPWVNRSYIEGILDALQNYRVTFFVTGIFIEKHPDIFERIARSHELGNHSYSHPDFVPLPDNERRIELRRAEELANSFGYTLKPLWRAPFGSRNSEVLQTAAEEGYPIHVFWTRDSGDWRDIPAEDVKNNVLRNAGNGDIVVQHCNSWQTAQVLPEIIKGLEDMGLEVTTVSVMLD